MITTLDPTTIYPGTILPDPPVKASTNAAPDHAQSTTRPGPVINGRSTTITLFNIAGLSRSDFLPSYVKVANEAFRGGHARTGVLPDHVDRLHSVSNLLEELGDDASTFTFVIHDDKANVIATVTMMRWTQKPAVEVVALSPEDQIKAERGKTFKRVEPMPDGIEAWELRFLFVDPQAQGHGLATELMKLSEVEVKQRLSKGRNGKTKETRVILTAIEEVNGDYYRRRGFTVDSRIWQPPGTIESKTGFHIVHMSKVLDTSIE